jgi:hypothetical protein
MASSSSDCTLIEKLRSPKILNMSVFDWITSMMGGLAIGKYVLHLKSAAAWVAWIVAWIVFGVIVHMIFKVKSMFGYYIGVNEKPVRDPARKCPITSIL